VARTQAYHHDEVGSGSQGTARGVWPSLPVSDVRGKQEETVRDTNQCKVLPNLFRLFAFSFPLLTDDLGNIGIIEPRILSDDRLLMVLPIKNKCYKEVSC
jgi:hypothetical protein